MESCPKCHGDGQKTEHMSPSTIVDYYLCAKCQTVWTAPKETRRDGRSGPGWTQ